MPLLEITVKATNIHNLMKIPTTTISTLYKNYYKACYKKNSNNINNNNNNKSKLSSQTANNVNSALYQQTGLALINISTFFFFNIFKIMFIDNIQANLLT